MGFLKKLKHIFSSNKKENDVKIIEIVSNTKERISKILQMKK
jgi:hypothetical protein